MIIDKEYAERLSYGSQILGFGGGGSAEEGLLMCEAAFEIAEKNGHSIELISIKELAARHPKGGKIVTISGVGSPAADTAYTPPDYYPRLMELLEKEGCRDIIGFISCEIGASSSFEPFLPAAMLGVPVIDAPCDGRAHPLGLMGALTLEKRGFSVLQVCVGGRKGSEGTRAEDKNAGQYVELSAAQWSPLLRWFEMRLLLPAALFQLPETLLISAGLKITAQKALTHRQKKSEPFGNS